MSDENLYRMRWDCLDKGCFNLHKRPKFEAFADAFPGKENFSDVDGILEKCGNALMLEWKEHAGQIPTGQLITFKNLSVGRRITVFILAGKTKDMSVKAMAFVFDGKYHDWKLCNMDDVHTRIRGWRKWAVAHPITKIPILRAV